MQLGHCACESNIVLTQDCNAAQALCLWEQQSFLWGALTYAGVHMHETIDLKYTPKHVLVMMQKSPPKQGFCL